VTCLAVGTADGALGLLVLADVVEPRWAAQPPQVVNPLHAFTYCLHSTMTLLPLEWSRSERPSRRRHQNSYFSFDNNTYQSSHISSITCQHRPSSVLNALPRSTHLASLPVLV